MLERTDSLLSQTMLLPLFSFDFSECSQTPRGANVSPNGSNGSGSGNGSSSTSSTSTSSSNSIGNSASSSTNGNSMTSSSNSSTNNMTSSSSNSISSINVATNNGGGGISLVAGSSLSLGTSSNMAVSRVPSPPPPEASTPVAENWCYTQVISPLLKKRNRRVFSLRVGRRNEGVENKKL